MLQFLFAFFLLLLLLATLPAWPYSRSWGYFPSGAIGIMLLLVAVLFLMRAM